LTESEIIGNLAHSYTKDENGDLSYQDWVNNAIKLTCEWNINNANTTVAQNFTIASNKDNAIVQKI